MENIKWTDVPSYLRNGAFFEGLDPSDEAFFSIPSDCFKADPLVNSERDLIWILCSVRFWAIRELPIDAIQYILENSTDSGIEDLFVEFAELQAPLRSILKVKAASLSDGIVVAIESGLGLPVVHLLREKGYELNAEACEAAAAAGDLECLMYLHTEDCPWDERTTTAAATGSQFTCLEYALDFSCPCDEEIVNKMAKLGLVEVLKTLHDRGFVWDEKTALHAISTNQLECLRFLHKAGCELTPTVFCTAAKNGALECMEYLRSLGVEWHPLTCYFAAQYGQLDALIYAHTHGAEWNELTSYAAASYGHLDCLIYLHKHDCTWNERALKGAIAGGYWSCAKYCYGHNCPCFQSALIVGAVSLIPMYMAKAYFVPYKPRFHDIVMMAIFFRVPLWMFLVEYRKALQRDSKDAWYWKAFDIVLVVFNLVLVYLFVLWAPLVHDFVTNYLLPRLGW